LRRSEKIENLKRRLSRLPFLVSFLTVFIIIFDLGFDQSPQVQKFLKYIYILTLSLGVISPLVRDFIKRKEISLKVWLFDTISVLYILLILLFNLNILPLNNYTELLRNPTFTYTALFLVAFREFSAQKINLKRTIFNPAQIFVLSFFLIILIGTLLLMLPNSTYDGISAVNALFTSTSAVCVTGLAVVDTGTYFTGFGITIIIILIQIGGLGIMTFASYFSYFFTGGSSYENHLVLSDMTNVDKLGEVFSTLKNIILLTVIIEVIGALFIFYNIDETVIPGLYNRISFSFFHSISGFCNAGFSTLPNGLYESGLRFNYPLHLTLAFLIIFGGLGFPIVFNTFKYIKHVIVTNVLSFNKRLETYHVPWVLNLNSRIILITTFGLILSGTILFYILEYNNVLLPHGHFGKIVTSFFGSVTTRTAGFNTIDNGALKTSTLLIFLILMWIGASPGSTGGGIKTSTFAIAVLNFISLAKGKTRIEIFRREISDISVRRAFAIITLSIIVIGIAVLVIAYHEKQMDLLSITFECVSAYSTVGLSVGITTKLCSISKIILVIVMFIGRVSMLSILLAIVSKEKHKNYRYPTEEIIIN
jgi:trk system potassium uptake protein TrkH